MSRINRIRIMNLNYNGNTIRIDDETFDLGGESTLLSLRNGGGKTVLVQMVISLFVNKASRDFADRPFKSYFTTNRPAFLMTEWKLDGAQGFFLVGMMVRKCQNPEENNNEELEMINFTSFYKQPCTGDLDNLPVIEEKQNSRALKGFGACKKEFEELKKKQSLDFAYYDMSNPNHRKMYFSKLKEYQINHKEWETIIKKVNVKESGLSELFSNAKDEKGLVEKWLLDAVENKLNQDKNKIKEFQKLAYKFIRQYRENQSKIKRKENIEQYFEDADEIKRYLSEYETAQKALEMQKSRIGAFIEDIRERMIFLEQEFDRETIEAEKLSKEILGIEHEKISYEIYLLEDEKEEKIQDRIASEIRITMSEQAKENAKKEFCRLQCAKLSEEAADFKESISELQGKLDIQMMEQKDSEEERKKLGGKLFRYYNNCVNLYKDELTEKENLFLETEKKKQECMVCYEKEISEKEEFYGKIKKLEAVIQVFDSTEEEFNQRFCSDSGSRQKNGIWFARNILGEYEEGSLELSEKKFQDEWTKLNVLLTRLSEKYFLLKTEAEKLERKSEELRVSSEQVRHELEKLMQHRHSMLEEKERRSLIMQHVSAPENELDNKELLIERLQRKVEELERMKDEYKVKQKESEREYENLAQGRIVELPENVLKYFEELGVEPVYGMTWLKKNGRSTEENQRLTVQNPFLPYSILLGKNDIQKLESADGNVYTNFPIPVIMREKLETALTQTDRAFLRLDKINFLVMFNKHLLDEKKLEKLLAEKQKKIKQWKEKIQIKNRETEEYRSYWNEIENQSFTLALIQENEEKIKKKKAEQECFHEEYLTCQKEKKNNAEEQIKINGQIESTKAQRSRAELRNQEYQNFMAAYQRYLENRQAKLRFEHKRKEAEKKAKNFMLDRESAEEKLADLREIKNNLEKKLAGVQSELVLFKTYQKEAMKEAEQEINYTEFDYMTAKVKYTAITKGISASISDLTQSLKRERDRYEKKEKELKKKNKYDFSEQEYISILWSEEQAERLDKNIHQAEREENAAKEENNRLEKEITRLETETEYMHKHLLEKTGGTILKERALIVDTDFETKLKLMGYEREKKQKEIEYISTHLEAFRSTWDVMAEYTDFTINHEVERQALEHFSREQLNKYQGMLRRDLKERENVRNEQKEAFENIIKRLAAKTIYQEDSFKKGFSHLLGLTDNVYHAKAQLETTRTSYENMLEKLKVDLEHIDRERKNIEEVFLEYVKDIDDGMRRIDKNSSISVRGKNKKMLKILVPDWENYKELYQIKISDYMEACIRRGIEAIENNQNVEELLGKTITTKKLYDEIVGIGNIDIRLYKIEAEREVQISWAEVSANSGGEGFLSAFVILSSLLSFMRRDDTDLFATGEEGKVLIMDNPFAQTNAEHLLKPLMDMAKKTNTQLICLSGLGGDSIYNRFDNIYVLNVVNSGLRQGMQYLTSRHVKGNEIKKMELAQFRVEQIELF